MANQIDYLPFATSGGANSDTQANFAGSGYQSNGFTTGKASSAQANKVWRQSSMIAAAWANVISETLNVNVLDDGNLQNLISFLQQTITTIAGQASSNYQTEITALQGRADVVDGEIAGIDNRLSAVESKNTAQDTAIASLGAQTEGSGQNFWREWPDGTIECWGLSSGASSSGNAGTSSITFAKPFTQGVQMLQLTAPNDAGNPISLSYANVTVDGATVQWNTSVPTGGGGVNVQSGAQAYYHAIGK